MIKGIKKLKKWGSKNYKLLDIKGVLKMINLLKNLIFEITTIFYANISFYIENMFLKIILLKLNCQKMVMKINIKKPLNYKN